MRWVAWVVWVSACAKPGVGTLAPAPGASASRVTSSDASAAPTGASATSGQLQASDPGIGAPVAPEPTLPSASVEVTIGNSAPHPKSKLCEVVLDGLTILRPCTGAAGEKPTGSVTRSSARGNCLVKVGDLEILRPCEGKPNERKAPNGKAATPPKMCEFVEGDIVHLRPCAANDEPG